MPGAPAGFTATLREGGLALALITTMAMGARLIRLDSGYWIDEIIALQRSFRLPMTDILTTFLGDNHHPLYSIFARATLVLFGEAPWALRLPAVAFGVAAVAATYLVGRLVTSRREALIASLLLAVSYHHVWFSQNARGYTLIGFLAVLSTWLLLRMLESPSWRLALAFAVCAALGAYTHLTMVFVAVGQALVVAVEWARPERGRPRIDWRIPALAFSLAAVLTVALYAPMLDQLLDFFINVPSQLRAASTPAWALREAVRVLALGVGATGAFLASVVLIAGLIIGVAGFFAIHRASRNAALAFALPPLMVLMGALIGRGTMYPRFFFFAAGTAVIVFVRGVFACAASMKRRWPSIPDASLATAFAGIVIVASAASLSFNYRYPKQDFAGAMNYVLASKAPGDVVGFAGTSDHPYPAIYGHDWPTVETAADVVALRARGRTWLIYTFPRYLAVGAPEVAAIVEHECHERAVFKGTVGGGDMIVCTLDPA